MLRPVTSAAVLLRGGGAAPCGEVSIRILKEVHERTHPARLTAAEVNDELAAEIAEEEAELAADTAGR